MLRGATLIFQRSVFHPQPQPFFEISHNFAYFMTV